MNANIDVALTENLEACPLCGGTSWKTLAVPGRWIGPEVYGELTGKIGLMKCRSCGLRFINPRPSTEKLTEFYSGDTYTCHEATGSSSAGAKADFVLNRIAESLPADSPRSLLDYGAGGGAFLLHARDHDWKVKGFEPGKRGLESCRKAGLDATDNLEELARGEYGLVTMHHVFEHLANPIEVLYGIRPLLADQGRLFIEVPNANSLRAQLAFPFLTRRLPIDERYRAYPIHLMYYSDSTLRQMLAKAGWTTEMTFTSGMGLDEYFIRAERAQDGLALAEKSGRVSTKPKRRLRHRLRDAYLSAGIGECLAAIAYPNRP